MMGNKISRLRNRLSFWKNQKVYRLLMISIDGFGVSTILYQFYQKKEKSNNISKLLGFKYAKMPHIKVKFFLNKVKYQQMSSKRSKSTYAWFLRMANSGLIFLVDNLTPFRIDLARIELKRIVEEDALQEKTSNSVILIMAKKSDKPTAMSSIEIAKKINILALSKQYNITWTIQTSYAFDDNSLRKGIDWLDKQLQKQKKELKGKNMFENIRIHFNKYTLGDSSVPYNTMNEE